MLKIVRKVVLSLRVMAQYSNDEYDCAGVLNDSRLL